MNEIYAKGSVEATSGNATVTLEGKIDEIEHSLLTLLAQEVRLKPFPNFILH